MPSFPFTIKGVFTGFVDLEGIVRLEPTALILEFQTRHALSEFFKSRPKEISIPLEIIEEAAFKRGWLGGTFTLRAKRLDAFDSVPGAEASELRLRCRRQFCDAAGEIAARISMRSATENLKEMIAGAEPRPPAIRQISQRANEGPPAKGASGSS